MEVFFMHILVFDEENEIDLENKVNDVLSEYNNDEVLDIKYSVAAICDDKEQIYCYSCLVILKD